MNFKFRPPMKNPNPSPNPYPPHFFHHPTPTFSYFTQQTIPVGLRNGDPRAREFGYPANPIDMRCSIERELEKERIRAEIIAEEIMRKRILEEEVRRELVMEGAFARGGFGAVASLGPMPRAAPPLLPNFKHPERVGDRLSPVRGVGFETVPFQRDPVVAGSRRYSGVRLQEIEVKGVVAPTQEVPKDNKVIILAKPSSNLADIKRKAMTPSVSGAVEVVKKQKTKEDWSCALCRVTATSERALKEHLHGKKHLARERGMVTQRVGFGTGPLPSTTNIDGGKSVQVSSLTSSPSFGKAGETDAESSIVIADNSEAQKTLGVEAKNTPLSLKEPFVDQKQNVVKAKNEGKPKKMFRFFCEMCQVGAYAQKVFNKHTHGKRHLAKLSQFNRTDKAAGGEASAQKGGMIENKEARLAADETVEGTPGEEADTNPEGGIGDQASGALGDETIAPKTTEQGSVCMEVVE